MEKIAIMVPEQAFPKKDLENPCPCQFRPVNLTHKKGTLTWLKDIGEDVRTDEVICEGEVEKKALEFLSPCDGILSEICIPDEERFAFGDIIGYIEVTNSKI